MQLNKTYTHVHLAHTANRQVGHATHQSEIITYMCVSNFSVINKNYYVFEIVYVGSGVKKAATRKDFRSPRQMLIISQ